MKCYALITVCLSLLFATMVNAQLKVTLGVPVRGTFARPVGNRLEVYRSPMYFYVIIENTSDETIEVYERQRKINPVHLEFHLTDSNGHKSIIYKKKKANFSKQTSYIGMKPGEEFITKILVDAEDWVGISTNLTKEASVVVVYKNGDKKVKSGVYNILFKSAKDNVNSNTKELSKKGTETTNETIISTGPTK